jgi:hypothetical protein
MGIHARRDDAEPLPLPVLADDEPVWRYVHLPKLVDFLARRQLPLVRVDLLGDRFEGSLPKGHADWLAEALQRAVPAAASADDADREAAIARSARLRRSLIRHTHASCWRAGRAESAAMWRAYCGTREGAALRTTFGHLRRAIDDPRTLVAPVHYLDFETERLPSLNLAYPLLCKRIEFAHEREVRVLRFRVDEWLEGLRPRSAGEIAGPPVEYLPVDPIELVEEVYVSPYAPEWYYDAVRVLIEKLAPPLADRLRWSRLADDPDWS